MRRIGGLLITLVGCGRLDFDPIQPDGPTTFPLPASLVCRSKRIAIDVLDPQTDLAIGADGSEAVALIASPGAAVRSVRLAPGLDAGPLEMLATGPVDAIPGSAVIGSATLFTTMQGTQQRLWHLDGATLTMVGQETSQPAANGLAGESTRTSFAWLRASGSNILASLVSPAGVVGVTNPIGTTGELGALAGADNDNHAHMMWMEGTSCRQGDVTLDPPMPTLGANGTLATNCLAPRIDSGPGSADAILTVWTSPTKTVEAWYQGSVVNMGTQLSPAGRGPKVRFDGTRFWVVWVDTKMTDVVRIAKLQEDLTFSTVDLEGWPIPSEEGLEIVKIGNVVYVAMLVDSALWLLETCP